MPIAVKCGSCGKGFRASDKLAGKKVKCPQCGGVLAIPKPSAPAEAPSAKAETAEDYAVASPQPARADASTTAAAGAPAAAAQPQCPACGSALAANAVLCVQCGYDLRSGRRLEVAAGPGAAGEPEGPGPAAAVVAEKARAAGSFLLGCVLSSVGALIGAAVWFGVAWLTGFESGIIALGLGILAGLGMVVGGGRGSDFSGITAAFISIAGIMAAKWLMFVFIFGESPTLGEFFTVMFDPLDSIFILLAFFTAYKVASGKAGD